MMIIKAMLMSVSSIKPESIDAKMLRATVEARLYPIILWKQAVKAIAKISRVYIGAPIFSDISGETQYTKLTRHWYKKNMTIEYTMAMVYSAR